MRKIKGFDPGKINNLSLGERVIGILSLLKEFIYLFIYLFIIKEIGHLKERQESIVVKKHGLPSQVVWVRSYLYFL